MNTAGNINILGNFLGKRDLSELSQNALRNEYGMEQADVMVLFGGSILAGGDVFASAIKSRIAKTYIIVGGEGHTTETLRSTVHEKYPLIETAGKAEAEVFSSYLAFKYGLSPDYIERKSTNCGNNITFLLDLINKNHIPCSSIILTQDASMQLRMQATLKKYRPDIISVNYAAYQATATEENGILCFKEKISGMWDMTRYITLLMGEIPRLTDNKNGYGPKGKGFTAHVDIPNHVQKAFQELCKTHYAAYIREANSKYASQISLQDKSRIG